MRMHLRAQHWMNIDGRDAAVAMTAACGLSSLCLIAIDACSTQDGQRYDIL